MSLETREWLSKYTLIGYTEKRGNAWHYRAGDDNHYVGPVPIEDVRRRLLNWEPVSVPLEYEHNGRRYQTDDQVIIRSDDASRLGIFRPGYMIHNFDEWLLTNVEGILDSSLNIGSAVLLENGAVCCIQVEMPETITTREGVAFRPFVNAFSSLNGKFATTYKTGVTHVVCDNTMRAAVGERTEQFKIKSTARSMAKLGTVREALGLVHAVAEDFEAEVQRLCELDFTDRQFKALTEELAPITPEMKPRGITMAEKKRETLTRYWNTDARVTPWANTGFAAWQAVNTYGQHAGTVRVGNRPERNYTKALNGKIEEADAQALDKILALAS